MSKNNYFSNKRLKINKHIAIGIGYSKWVESAWWICGFELGAMSFHVVFGGSQMSESQKTSETPRIIFMLP